MRFRFVFPNLACGEMMKTPEEMDFVLSRGITHIINLQIGCNAPMWYFSNLREKYPDVEFLHLYFSDDEKGKARWIIWNTILSYAGSVLSCVGNKLYVHCALGESRSPAILYLILRVMWLYSAKKAKEVLKKKYFKPTGIVAKYSDYVEGIDRYVEIKEIGGER